MHEAMNLGRIEMSASFSPHTLRRSPVPPPRPHPDAIFAAPFTCTAICHLIKWQAGPFAAVASPRAIIHAIYRMAFRLSSIIHPITYTSRESSPSCAARACVWHILCVCVCVYSGFTARIVRSLAWRVSASSSANDSSGYITRPIHNNLFTTKNAIHFRDGFPINNCLDLIEARRRRAADRQ